MAAYAIRRLCTLLVVVVLAMAFTFVILGSLYGSIYGHVTVWHQLGALPRHLVRIFGHLDFGYDDDYHQPLSHSLQQGLPVDASLMLGGLFAGIVMGLGLGVIGGPRPKSAIDNTLMIGSSMVISAPVYLLATVVAYEFSSTTGSHHLGFVSGAGNYTALTSDPIGWLRSMWVPWLIIGAPLACVTYRMTRAVIREDLEADYIRTARAKGLRERVVMRRHAFRAALPPILGTVAVTVPTVVINTILLETAMEMPGLFTRFDISPQVGDNFHTPGFPIIQVLVLETVALVATGIFICDVLHAALDPKIRR